MRELSPELKILKAELIRQKFENYFCSQHFKLLLLEKNIDKSFNQELERQSIRNTERNIDAFLFLLENYLNKHEDLQRYNNPNKAHYNLLIFSLDAIFIGFYSSQEKQNSYLRIIECLNKIKILEKSDLKQFETKLQLLQQNKISPQNKELTVAKVIEKLPKNKTEVFIVHGHDDEAKTKTARFIEKLGFRPIILHEQAISGNTIIENIEQYSNVGFGIILYTPCDLGAKKEDKPKYKNRARQNVVFEHGFLIGKIGRKNVCALVKDQIETPNDVSGLLYIKMDQEEAWHLKLAKEMRNSGYKVDMNKL